MAPAAPGPLPSPPGGGGRLDALALVELDSIARGYLALDALVKRAPVRVLEANLVEPGRFLLLFAGGVAEVEESFAAALERAEGGVVDRLLLPMVHPAVLPGLAGRVQVLGPEGQAPDTLGVVESRTVAAGLWACDRALKDAGVRLAGLRLAPALGGRLYFVVEGAQHDVEAALEAATAVLNAQNGLHRVECIARPHEDLIPFLLRPAPFALSLPGEL